MVKLLDLLKEEVGLDQVRSAEMILQNLKKNISTNSNIPTQDKVGILKALEELEDFVDGVGYDLEIGGGPNEAKTTVKTGKESGEKFIKCRNCRKLFTQTIHKGKKSLPICPTCKTHN